LVRRLDDWFGDDMRALVIEDETLVAFLLEEMLESLGYDDVEIAATEAAAVTLAHRLQPDLVTADARLAQGCGISAALAICARRPVPVVFVTGNAAHVARRVQDPVVIEKPFTLQELAPGIMRARCAPGVRPVGESA
jgi:CheY-like chemotaxis protein